MVSQDPYNPDIEEAEAERSSVRGYQLHRGFKASLGYMRLYHIIKKPPNILEGRISSQKYWSWSGSHFVLGLRQHLEAGIQGAVPGRVSTEP